MAKKNGKQPRPRAGKQDALGEEMEHPPQIKAIDNACDEVFDALDESNGVKERLEKARTSLMGVMRAAGVQIYKYRDRTVTFTEATKLQVKNDKPFSKRRHAEAE